MTAMRQSVLTNLAKNILHENAINPLNQSIIEVFLILFLIYYHLLKPIDYYFLIAEKSAAGIRNILTAKQPKTPTRQFASILYDTMFLGILEMYLKHW